MGNGRKSVAIGGFDEKENINKIICQNISKQLCKLRTVVEYRCLLPSPHTKEEYEGETELEAEVEVQVSRVLTLLKNC